MPLIFISQINRIIFVFIALLYAHKGFTQVGIGTTTPTAELEIQTTNTGIPALEINPQTAPTGTITGQLSLIGDKLYMYDATRTKWLSIETVPLQYGRNGNANNNRLHFGGNMNNNNSGAMMPLNGTITAISMRSNGGLATKGFEIRVRRGTTAQTTTSLNLVASEYISTTDNIDFNSGDYINIHAVNAGAAATNVTAILWIKWRQ